MSDVRLRMTQANWKVLQRTLRVSFTGFNAPEAGAIGVLGETLANGTHEFLLAKLFPPEPGDLKVAENQELVFDASYIRRAHLFMRQKGLAGLVVFHTHPGSDERVRFSFYDNVQEPLLVENLQAMAPQTRLVSVVAGKRSLCGRLWTDPGGSSPLGTLVVVGDTLEYRRLDGEPEPPPPTPGAAFDRALALTGAGALARLTSMTAAVVGVSGTGSLVAELLLRAGCGRLLLIDDDRVRDVNLNRILHSTVDDEKRGTPKVQCLKRELDRIGFECTVEAIDSNVLLSETLLEVRRADVVFGCLDLAWPRELLSEFSFRYLKPYIDVGTEIGGDKEGIVALNARTNYVAPGRPCLTCLGLVNPRRLAFESMCATERARVKAQGYSDDLALAQPAVMDLNMHAAGMGMMVLRHLLQPFLLSPIPAAVSENLVTYTTLAIREAKDAREDCPVCKCNDRMGWGDKGKKLGVDAETLQAIRGHL